MVFQYLMIMRSNRAVISFIDTERKELQITKSKEQAGTEQNDFNMRHEIGHL
jgi:hypothetical protein